MHPAWCTNRSELQNKRGRLQKRHRHRTNTWFYTCGGGKCTTATGKQQLPQHRSRSGYAATSSDQSFISSPHPLKERRFSVAPGRRWWSKKLLCLVQCERLLRRCRSRQAAAKAEQRCLSEREEWRRRCWWAGRQALRWGEQSGR